MTEAESELPKTFEAGEVENKWYSQWQEKGYFKADAASAKPAYCLVMPPPNVTGVLHMGHALVTTLQDVLVRWRRMSGDEVLWIPGTDHAGIATQTVVERSLHAKEGKRRNDYSREEFLKHVWAWKEKSQHQIINQIKRVGCSCDWSRLRFTMDASSNLAVRTMFKRLFDQGLIYQGNYLVNWDPVTQTALADDEVEYEDRAWSMWHIRYPGVDGSEDVIIATTRPEVLLGDTAVAVSPKDPRYQHLIGKKVRLPLMDRQIPIIADDYVDPEFGTGMVKITPAHDPNDYQMGQRHNLAFINVMTPDGKINENGGRFAGLTMDEAREAIVKALQEGGYLIKTTPHVHRIGRSYRSKAIIEPYISKQWFVKMDGFATKLRAAVESGRTRLIPEAWNKVYFHWIDNLRDWCISRQLWWGHRIPIWTNNEDPTKRICYEGEGLPAEVAANPDGWTQDPDVLDTWFSSGLWPMSTLGWPDESPDFKKFYPNSLLVTGHDILFFWVARMLFMCEQGTDQLPYPEVFLHGLIYGKSYWRTSKDGHIAYVNDQERLDYDLGKPTPPDVQSKWEKMSKTKGNVLDPIEIIEQYGADAMRMALCSCATQARQIDLDRRRIEEFKNFANKVWNGARFVMMNLEGLTAAAFSEGLCDKLLGLEDRWILSVLNRTVRDVTNKLAKYAFDQAAVEAYDFFWKEFCAFYVEITKPILFGKQGTPADRTNKQKLLVIVLCQALRLLHPMAPFITEELFQRLRERFAGLQLKEVDVYTQEAVTALQSPFCIVAPYPKVVREQDINPAIDLAFDLVERAVYIIRNIRGEMKLPPSTATDLHFYAPAGDPHLSAIQKNQGIIRALVRVQNLELHTELVHLPFASVGVIETVKIFIPVPEELFHREQARLLKEQERLTTAVDKARAQLSNQEFVTRAPPALVEKQQQALAQIEQELASVRAKLANP